MDPGQHLVNSAIGKQVLEYSRDICKGTYISMGDRWPSRILEVADV